MTYEKKLELANKIISAVVKELFITFLNPMNRGPFFEWRGFPKSCGKMCAAYVAADIDGPTWDNYAREKGEKVARKVMRANGFWMV
jgi:hypothetical protein